MKRTFLPYLIAIVAMVATACGNEKEGKDESAEKEAAEPEVCDCFTVIQEELTEAEIYSRCKEIMKATSPEKQAEITEKLMECDEYKALVDGISKNANIEMEAEEKDTATVSCEEYLKRYDAFMDDFVELYDKYKNNPTSEELSADYEKMMGENDDWAKNIDQDCATDPDFISRITEINMRFSNAMKN